MKRNPKHVVVWDGGNTLFIDLPKGTTLHMVNGMLRAAVPNANKGELAIYTLANLVGQPVRYPTRLIKEQA